ncbi:hypothetical protein OJF2_29940 [Aquisphaera giovannonii]|uniref:Uncharacterized protein n=1 Tax=Aquisphaera giovannonii TaxID=406548 RepID=A0A5B9W323_9BACT|nr:hypothetical protein [Aquisphaera giovannonii]QEH34455.1 hypothetical protein OJF2_29940 [Aquisphaera giovannonii]
MNVYMLLRDEKAPLFYHNGSSPDEPPQPDAAPAPGFCGRLLLRWRRFQEDFRRADSGTLGWCRHAWDWLHSRTQPDEPMLFRFRSAGRIDLHHPRSRDREDVAAAWHAYLADRRRRHAIRLAGNLLVAPVAGLLLFPLPGPNLIGYWFAYRTIHHALVLGGLRRAIRGRIPTSYHAEAWLDLPVEGNPWRHGRPAA